MRCNSNDKIDVDKNGGGGKKATGFVLCECVNE